MKKQIKMLLAIGMAAACFGSVSVQAGQDIKIVVDNRELVLDTQAVQKNSRTLVPFRAIADSLNAQVTWDGNNKRVICEKNGVTLVLTVDSDIMLKNGNAVKLDTTPIISNGRVLVPVRALSEGFNANVSWYAEERMIVIRSDLGKGDEILEADNEKVAVEFEHIYKEYQDGNGNIIFVYDCNMPKPVGGVVANKIAGNIASNTDYYFNMAAEEFKQEAELAANIAYAQHTTMSPYRLSADTKVTYNQNGILSLVISYGTEGCDFVCDGYKTNRLDMTLVYNTKTGSIIELKDMVNEKALTKAKSAIISVIKKDEKDFYDDYVKRIQNKEPKYYVTEKGVTFVYDDGYLKKPYKGDVRYTMSFDELNK